MIQHLPQWGFRPVFSLLLLPLFLWQSRGVVPSTATIVSAGSHQTEIDRERIFRWPDKTVAVAFQEFNDSNGGGSDDKKKQNRRAVSSHNVVAVLGGDLEKKMYRRDGPSRSSIIGLARSEPASIVFFPLNSPRSFSFSRLVEQ